MAIQGKLIGLRIGTDFVPCETNLVLNFQVEKLNKSSSVNGSWEHHRNGYKSWSVSVDARLLISAVSSSFNSLFRAYLNDESISLVIQNRDLNGQPFLIWGDATIQQGTLEAPSLGSATWQVQFKGNGALSEEFTLFWNLINAMPHDADKPLVINTGI